MKEIFDYKELINKHLELFFASIKSDYPNLAEKADFFERIREYTLRGGKRLRALLLIASYICFKEFDEEIVKAALSMELLQSYLLIHDDVMDRDDLRRGRPTIHKAYEDEFRNFNSSYAAHLGNSFAILVGDLTAALIYEPIMKSELIDGKKILAVEAIKTTLIKECYGQGLDMFLSMRDLSDVKKEEVIEMYKLKTVPYTTELPFTLGAIFGNASKQNTKKFIDIAEKIGVAFQLRDDLLGIFGEEEKTGKSSSNDLKEAKKTFPLLDALEKAPMEEREFMLECIGGDMSEKELQKIKEIVKIKSLASCEEYIFKLKEDAVKTLDGMKLRDEGKRLLLELIDFIANRNF